jgi:hypothetical protein
MTFTHRVGLEPATDLKNRIASLCEEAGFVVVSARMTMCRRGGIHDSFRVIEVSVREPTWKPRVLSAFKGSLLAKHRDRQIEVRAFIDCDGTFGGEVQFLCMAHKVVGEFGPSLQGCRVPIDDIPQHLPPIAESMRTVAESFHRGNRGPWVVGGYAWKPTV